jgi:signal transduction histidine kinase
MSEARDSLPEERGLAFFGAITASVTHELNNVVAVVNELAGLLDDLLYAAEEGRPIDSGKLRSLQEKLSRQVSRGEGLIKRLNRFAHTADKEILDYELIGLLNNLADLCRRFAVLKKTQLETDFPEEPIRLTGNPFKLQHAVYLSLRHAFDTSSKDDVISIRAEKSGSDINIAVTGSRIDADRFDEENLALLQHLMKDLAGESEIISGEDNTRSIVLTIPESVKTDSGRS